MKREKTVLSDLEECKLKIKLLLNEYNCSLLSADECSHVLLMDEDTYKTINAQN
jgi:hypothetical protein